jgi:hypothetical protein
MLPAGTLLKTCMGRRALQEPLAVSVLTHCSSCMVASMLLFSCKIHQLLYCALLVLHNAPSAPLRCAGVLCGIVSPKKLPQAMHLLVSCGPVGFGCCLRMLT